MEFHEKRTKHKLNTICIFVRQSNCDHGSEIRHAQRASASAMRVRKRLLFFDFKKFLSGLNFSGRGGSGDLNEQILTRLSEMRRHQF